MLIAKQGTCIFVWFLHFFSCLPKPTRQNAHVSTCNKNFTCTNYCLYVSPWSYSFDKDCLFRFLYMLDQKDYNPYLMITVLYYLSSKLDSEPAYLQRTSKIIYDNTIEYWDSALFCIYISNVSSLKCIGHVSILFSLGYEIANSFSQQMYSQMTLCSINPDIINHSL